MKEESWHSEVSDGKRFQFGKNWSSYSKLISDERIRVASESLTRLFGENALEGSSFLDVGCGSGLFSLAAYKLGAKVVSFDFDPQSVACAQELAKRYGVDDKVWIIEGGSALDQSYLSRIEVRHGQFDFVYSWGVLHHTGQMWQAINNITNLVKPGGKICIALYTDQGVISKIWWIIKRIYCLLPSWLRWLVLLPVAIFLTLPVTIKDLLSGKGLGRWRNYKDKRGMSFLHDIIDWVGGYPYEVARPEEVIQLFEDKGFALSYLKKSSSYGCSEYVFQLLEKS